MAVDEDFEPRLGRMHARGGRRGRKYLYRVLAAANLARAGAGGASGSRGFAGSRIGRGAGVGRLLARRGPYSAFRARRVIVKARIARLSGKGAVAAVAHLRYIQRDGVTREGAPGDLYGPETDRAEPCDFLARGQGDRHQFRFIVSPEDGAEYDDLKPLTRRLMHQVEQDLGTSLDWVAVDHFNTGHPHSHIIVRGTDDRGKDLIIARDYLTRGIRERACELVDLDLGPRTTREIETALRQEITQDRLTSIDRAMLRDARDHIVAATGRDAFTQSLRAGRLKTLEKMELATPLGAGRWRLDSELGTTLKRMGERGDIIRTMQRAFSEKNLDRSVAGWRIHDRDAPDQSPVVGKVVSRGLADEHADRHYLIVDGVDGRSHYLDIGAGGNVEALASGAIVRVASVKGGISEVDRTVAAIAVANDGRYTANAHRGHDPSATEAFVKTHIRRLEAMRRRTGAPERHQDGSWAIGADHLTRAERYAAAVHRDRPVTVTILSARRLDMLVGTEGATWLDRELIANRPESLRDQGFGREVGDALARRRQWLIARGLAEERGGRTFYRKDLVTALQRRELLKVAGQLAKELDLPFREMGEGARIEGVYRRSVALASGKFAVIAKSREFTLVPWRPVLERHVGKSVSGIVRERGINWSFGRGRGGPSIS